MAVGKSQQQSTKSVQQKPVASSVGANTREHTSWDPAARETRTA